ncbi:MAG: iron donor protein CyaY [Myxococcales bacterium]|nr:iron donor protein CyaY [Myxococcales bacterium]
MERKEFFRLSARALERIDDQLGELDREDLDVNLAGDVLTVSFADGAQFIINAHSAAGQIWMAAGTTAWHFDYHPDEGRWIASRNGDELMAAVAQAVGEKLGARIEL